MVSPSLASSSPAAPVSHFTISNPQSRRSKFPTIHASVSARTLVAAAPDGLVASILSKIMGTDRGVLLTADGHKEVADVANELAGYCIEEPVKSRLIFGGKLKVLDDKWIQVIFEPPRLKVGSLKFHCGGESEVKLKSHALMRR